MSSESEAPDQESRRPHGQRDRPLQRLRLTFSKGEALKYISHLDLARAWERAFRRASLPVAYSQGFNPRARFQIAAALPVGVTGRAELLDVWLEGPADPEVVRARLEPVLPAGLKVLAAIEVDLRGPSLQSQMRAADYEVVCRTPEPLTAMRTRLDALLETPMLLRQRPHKGKWQTYDLRSLIEHLAVAGAEGVTGEPGSEQKLTVTMRLQASPEGAGRPDEVLDALGLSAGRLSAERTKLVLEFDN